MVIYLEKQFPLLFESGEGKLLDVPISDDLLQFGFDVALFHRRDANILKEGKRCISIGPFGTFWDNSEDLDKFGALGEDCIPSHFRPIPPIIG